MGKYTFMRKLIYSLLTALLLVAAAVVLHKNKTGDQELFQANVEALARYELCPGEQENCKAGGERCIYSYNSKNYNIENESNKR